MRGFLVFFTLFVFSNIAETEHLGNPCDIFSPSQFICSFYTVLFIVKNFIRCIDLVR